MKRHVATLAASVLLAASSARAHDDEAGFSFGTYGRVQAATDLEGGTPRPANVVAHGPRIVEDSYVELDLRYLLRPRADVRAHTVATLALRGEPFHYTGRFEAQLAIRNLYLGILRGPAHAWVGSRMLRGDDIYLLDFWPLDEANLLGGGVDVRLDPWALSLYGGLSRPLDPFHFQKTQVQDRVFGATDVVVLDRQRMTAGAVGAWASSSFKAKLLAEAQALPSGTRLRADDTVEELPSDAGFAFGAQAGVFGALGETARASHVNLFLRLGFGLAAYGDLAIPFGFGPDRRVFPDAQELILGLSADAEHGPAGMLVGGYLRRFADADEADDDPDDGWEWVLDARPFFTLARDVAIAADLSYQERHPRGLSPSALVPLDAAVLQLAPMLLYTPTGPGSFARPQLRLVWRIAHRNEGARDLYPEGDPRRGETWDHYLGLQAEWWYQSSYR